MAIEVAKYEGKSGSGMEDSAKVITEEGHTQELLVNNKKEE